MSWRGLAFRNGAIASAFHPAISDFLANGCVQASEEAVDFRRVILNNDLLGQVSNSSEVEHSRSPIWGPPLIPRRFRTEEYGFLRRTAEYQMVFPRSNWKFI